MHCDVLFQALSVIAIILSIGTMLELKQVKKVICKDKNKDMFPISEKYKKLALICIIVHIILFIIIISVVL